MQPTEKITLIKPDDAHLHLRDDIFLKRTVPDAAERFARAIIMPNLKPPITTVEAARQYKNRILSEIPKHLTFKPLMTLYLTEHMTPDIIKEAKHSGFISAVKLYPAGVTTHSEFGVTDLDKMAPVFKEMEACGLPLLIHGETNDSLVDIFDREKVFLRTLSKLVETFPKLKIVLEHITSKDAVDFILSCEQHVAATITIHHLLLNRNDLLAGGIKPHHYCLPILKTRADQEALIAAAISGDPRFFLGTDSAPHAQSTKENACGCAGIYSEHAAIELYAEVFEAYGALDKLENFASRYGAQFYGLPENKETITLSKRSWKVPQFFSYGEETLIPLYAGETIQWCLN